MTPRKRKRALRLHPPAARISSVDFSLCSCDLNRPVESPNIRGPQNVTTRPGCVATPVYRVGGCALTTIIASRSTQLCRPATSTYTAVHPSEFIPLPLTKSLRYEALLLP